VVKTSTAALALVIATASPLACTVFNDMSGYAGGVADTGEAAEDTGAKVDSFVPPMDTGTPKDSAADTTVVDDTEITDSGVDTTTPDTGTPVDSGIDTFVPDTFVPDTSVTDTGTDTAPLGCHVVINEVQTRGTVAGDEFIELYNPCTSTIDLSGYKVVYRSATGTTDVTVATITAGKTIAASGFFVVGNGSFATAADQPFTASGIADDGAAAVRDPMGTKLDSLGWGTIASTHAFVETAPAPRPASGASISRVPNGTDTDNNSVDFKASTSTPKS